MANPREESSKKVTDAREQLLAARELVAAYTHAHEAGLPYKGKENYETRASELEGNMPPSLIMEITECGWVYEGIYAEVTVTNVNPDEGYEVCVGAESLALNTVALLQKKQIKPAAAQVFRFCFPVSPDQAVYNGQVVARGMTAWGPMEEARASHYYSQRRTPPNPPAESETEAK